MAGVKITETLYTDEYGFYIEATTALDLNSLSLGDVKFVLKKPDGTVVTRDVAISDWTNLTTGTVRLQIVSGDLDQTGPYQIQVVIRDVANSILRPSHFGKFSVSDPVTDLTTVFV